jgi:hypothetical protein
MQAVVEGYRCLLDSEALIFDEPSKSTRQESIRKRRTIAGAAQLVRLFPQWLLPWRNPLWFEYVSHKLLRLASPLLMALVIAANVSPAGISPLSSAADRPVCFLRVSHRGVVLSVGGTRFTTVWALVMFVTLNLTTVAALWDALFARYRVTWQKTLRVCWGME